MNADRETAKAIIKILHDAGYQARAARHILQNCTIFVERAAVIDLDKVESVLEKFYSD